MSDEKRAHCCTVGGCDQPAPGMMQLCDAHARQYDETGKVPDAVSP